MKKAYGNEHEQGFILVTTLVLLAVLTALGLMSAYKSVVEVKVSRMSGESARALMVANAGLATVYDLWGNNPGEFANTLADMDAGNSGTGVLSSLFEVTYSPSSLNDTSNLPSDGTIQSSNSHIRVFELTSSSFTELTNKSTWGSSKNMQVAVWATRFDAPTHEYPFETPDRSGTCQNCNLVVYALGRFGDSRRLVRQAMSVGDYKLDGVSALTNAPNYRNWMDMCNGQRTGNGQKYFGTGYNNTNSADVAWTGQSRNADALIEVTQAEYLPNTVPSGVAIASNTHTGGGGKNFVKGTSSTTVATFDTIPIIAYSGHGTNASDNAVAVNYADTTVQTQLPADNLPNNGKLPRNLINDRAFDTSDEITYFQGDPNTQLFNMDVYRWAAEQFTCQTLGSGSTALTAATAGSGKYCLKADKLRAAMGNPAPVTGRLTLAEFEYNVAHSIPMFGIVRVMYPVGRTGTQRSSGCSALNNSNAAVYEYDVQDPTRRLEAKGSYDGDENTLDSDGSLGSNAKIIVYGTLFFDFYVDDENDNNNNDGNGLYEPASGERLANVFESIDVLLFISVPAYVNPALPKFTNGDAPGNFPTGAAGGVINTNTAAAKPANVPVNLASPQGWFPSSEGLIPDTNDMTVGSMKEAMNLIDMALQIAPSSAQGGGGKTFASSSGPGIWTAGTNEDRYKYYYQLMRSTADRSDSNAWPIEPAAAPSTLNGNICIGARDCNAGNNEGDKMHLLFPSGYHHGWKVALAALNITATEWNDMVSDLDTLAANLKNGGNPYDPGSTARPRGSPFNTGTDTGFVAANVTDIMNSAADYFHLTEDSTTGYGLLDSDWRDVPAMLYAGGIVDIHEYNNVSGIVYTPGPMEWETGFTSDRGNATGYVNGAIITGFGQHTRNNQGDGHQIYVYDNQAVDNINTANGGIVLRRYAWQELK